MTYQTVGSEKAKIYPIEPLRLFYFRGGLYLISRMAAYNQLITQAVERIQALELTEETFEIPRDLSVEERLEHSFGVIYEDPFDVKVRFSPEQAPYINSGVSSELDSVQLTGPKNLSSSKKAHHPLPHWANPLPLNLQDQSFDLCDC